ncbi:MAG: ATP-binding protein [Acidimicrobiales bacterium]
MTLVNSAESEALTSIAAFAQNADPAYVQGLQRIQNACPAQPDRPVRRDRRRHPKLRERLDPGWRRHVAGQRRIPAHPINGLINSVITGATDAARAEARIANDEARSYMVLAGSVILLALAMAIVIGRSISRPLIRLTRNAEQLSSEELPALVESMRSAGRTEAPVFTPIEAKGRDEVAQLAHAISEIQQVTIDVAEEQGALLRQGIADIFVNLARRNQSLLDRQIDFIDQLESREENPDQLENLFRLDHLATRMRRNAESLLVLAGAEPTRRRGRPVEIVDVLRVAMGEIEDFSRINLESVETSTVAGSVAVDLAHLMSELMENATQFSPPEAGVDVVGYRIGDGSYQLTVEDHGIGMSAEQLAVANQTLAESRSVGLDLSRSLGFTVVSRLAHRLGVAVQLTSGLEGGITAVITIPAEMIGEADRTQPADEPEAVAADAPADVAPAEAAPFVPTEDTPFPQTPSTTPATAQSASEGPVPDEAEQDVADTADDGALAALPTREPQTLGERPGAGGDLFAAFASPATTPDAPADPAADLFAPITSSSGLPTRTPGAAKPIRGAATAGGPAPAEPPRDASPATDEAPVQMNDAPVASAAPLPTRDPAEIGAVSAQVTSAGLIKRQPRKVDVPDESMYAAGNLGASNPGAAEPSTPTPNRSPDEVRQMLSRYRAGLRKGRVPEPGTDQPNRRS